MNRAEHLVGRLDTSKQLTIAVVVVGGGETKSALSRSLLLQASLEQPQDGRESSQHGAGGCHSPVGRFCLSDVQADRVVRADGRNGTEQRFADQRSRTVRHETGRATPATGLSAQKPRAGRTRTPVLREASGFASRSEGTPQAARSGGGYERPLNALARAARNRYVKAVTY